MSIIPKFSLIYLQNVLISDSFLIIKHNYIYLPGKYFMYQKPHLLKSHRGRKLPFFLNSFGQFKCLGRSLKL